jgi:SET family sugar efflux transporter-like MFS transporter
MALTGGWVIGPVAGSFLAAETSLRTMLVATAICTLVQVVPLGTQRTPAAAPSAEGAPDSTSRSPGLRAMVPLLAFTTLYVLVYAGEPIKYAYLPIYMNDQLHLAAGLSGAIIGIQPLVEIVLMPLAVLVARRTGMMRLMILGAGFGVAANICFAVTGTPAGLFAGQIFMGAVWGIFAALGIIVAQRLLPTAVATASAIFLSCTALASAFGGAAGGVGAAVIGLPHVFIIPAALGLLAVVGLTFMVRSSRESDL